MSTKNWYKMARPFQIAQLNISTIVQICPKRYPKIWKIGRNDCRQMAKNHPIMSHRKQLTYFPHFCAKRLPDLPITRIFHGCGFTEMMKSRDEYYKTFCSCPWLVRVKKLCSFYDYHLALDGRWTNSRLSTDDHLRSVFNWPETDVMNKF